MAEINPNAKYGNTSPVKLCGEAHGVPADIAYCLADNMLHRRKNVWTDMAWRWVDSNMGSTRQQLFFDDFSAVIGRAI